MHLNVNVRIPVARVTEADFIVPLLVDVLAPGSFVEDAPGDDLQSEFVVGRVWAERLDWADAEEHGLSAARICQQASPTWTHVLNTLTRKRSRRFRKDLDLNDFIGKFIFVHETLLHPEIEDRLAVMDGVLNSISASETLVLMHYEQGQPHHLEDWEYRDLGFKKIARTSLLLKDSRYRYPFGDAFPGGRQVELVANAEHESWLLEHWDGLIADHPSL